MKLQEFCRKAAERMLTPYGSNAAKYGFDWLAVLTFVMSLLDDCPASDDEMVAAIAEPTAFQSRWAVRKARQACDDCCSRRFSGDARELAESVRVEAQALAAKDVRAMREEAAEMNDNPGF